MKRISLTQGPVLRQFLIFSILGLYSFSTLRSQVVNPTVTPLSPVTILTNTSELPQSKVWTHVGKHFTVLGTSAGTVIMRLDGATWTSIFTLASGNFVKADIKTAGDIVHILVYKGSKSVLYSVEYVPTNATYKLWTVRKNRVDFTIEGSNQSVTIDIDATGRMWMASDGKNDVNVRWSDAPYAAWSAPIKLETNTSSTDMCAVVALPGKIGVFWSNKVTKRFAFKTHDNGADPSIWSADEAPASQSALNIGTGFAENQFNLKVAPSGKLYVSVKTGYNSVSNTQLALLVRETSGTWNDAYPVTVGSGRRPMIIINEALDVLKVVYTSASGIAYKQSKLNPISFGAETTLLSGAYDNVTGAKNPYTGSAVVLASNASSAVGALVEDVVGIDETPPVVSAINRLTPSDQNTSATTVTYRVVFSEEVTGVTADDFVFTQISGGVTGAIAPGAVTAVGSAGTTYDVEIGSIDGSGTFRLDLKETGTSIADAPGNAINGGFNTGQTYIKTVTAPPLNGFATVTQLTPVSTSMDTKDKPQAKVWKHNNKWWTVLSVSDGTKIFRLDGVSWTPVLTVSTKKGKNDVRVVGNLVHVLMYKGEGSTSLLYTIEYVNSGNTYKPWTVRPGKTDIEFPDGSETANLAMDGTGRLWATSAGTTQVYVWYSDYPYSSWSSGIQIKTGIKDDDISVITALPNEGKIAVLYSNQNAKRYGFTTHNDGDAPEVWSTEEIPAAQSAINNVGSGMADDHLNTKVGSDGTFYCATKTSYNKAGYAKVALLIRRPNGVWDNLHTVTTEPEGTQPAVIVNENKNVLKVVYCTKENGGKIVYRESSLSNISFGPARTLISNGSNLYDYVSTASANYSPDIVLLATNLSTNPKTVAGLLCSDENGSVSSPAVLSPKSSLSQVQEESVGTGAGGLKLAQAAIYPNPYHTSATLTFTLADAGQYSVLLYNNMGSLLSVIGQGYGAAGTTNAVRIDKAGLTSGVYFLRIQTTRGSQTVKLVKR